MHRLFACLVFLVLASPTAANVAVDPSTAAATNVVLEWNSIWLDCIRATGGAPGPIGKAGAMVHVAMVDAIVSIEGGYAPYLRAIPTSRRTSVDAAAAQAAHDVLVSLYPARLATLDSALTASLARVTRDSERRPGVQVGQLAAAAVIQARLGDGSDDAMPYVVGTGPGEWRPTWPDYAPAVGPNWGRVKPWAIESGDQFRTRGPLGTTDMSAILQSRGYTRIFDEVKTLGARNSTRRTERQTQTAFFWANDVNGTYKPPGHLNHIAQVLARQNRLSVVRTARLFALLNIALADAGVAAWDCKYDTRVDFWRPITGIREADTDGNPLTVADPGWEPLNAFTPAFPAYISGHATFGAAAAAVFTRFFRTDRMTYTISTDEPLYTGLPRTYRSFSEAALENGRSRIYLGVHWQFDADDGYACGTALGTYVARHVLRPTDRWDDDRDVIAGDADPAGAEVMTSDASVELGVRTAPAGDGTTIALDQPAEGHARVSVIDVQGRRLASLYDGPHAAGAWSVSWDGRGDGGVAIGPGVYFVLAEAAGYRGAQRIVVVK